MSISSRLIARIFKLPPAETAPADSPPVAPASRSRLHLPSPLRFFRRVAAVEPAPPMAGEPSPEASTPDTLASTVDPEPPQKRPNNFRMVRLGVPWRCARMELR